MSIPSRNNPMKNGFNLNSNRERTKAARAPNTNVSTRDATVTTVEFQSESPMPETFQARTMLSHFQTNGSKKAANKTLHWTSTHS